MLSFEITLKLSVYLVQLVEKAYWPDKSIEVSRGFKIYEA